MNVTFLIYFILIISLSFLRKYKWSIGISIPAVIHIYWTCAKTSSPIPPLAAATFSIFMFNLSIFLMYQYQTIKQEALENIKIIYQNEENKLKQLSAQEKSLQKKNKELERRLSETVTIYEYVKRLGSTLDFDEAVTLLQETLRSLIEFSRARLVLTENGNIAKIYNIYYEPKKPWEIQSSEITGFEKSLIDKIIKNPQTVFYEKGKFSPIGQLPPDINALLVIPLVVEKQLVSILALENLLSVNFGRIQLVAIQFALEVKKTQLYQKVKELSIIDSLTQLYVRRHFQELLVNELDRCHRLGQPLSFLMLDIDWFKRYNDEYGHLVGDLILKVIGSIIKQKSREIDLLCRYGGDEFALALPRTGSKEVQPVAERFRRAINEYLFHVAKEEFQVAVSIGVVTCLPQDMQKSNISAKLIDLADSAMYQAKSQGRNRVVISPS